MIFCFNNRKSKIILISFAFSTFFILFQIGFFGINELNIGAKIENDFNITNEANKVTNSIYNTENYLKNEINNTDIIKEWKIEIPKINLIASIKEGTTVNTLNEFVGHFEETQKQIGNIGLAAHNRGYPVNYFENIKFLEVNDEIHYYYDGIKKVYVVNSKKIIKDTDWTWLENTNDNRITLITCVENQPRYRLCLQGIEK